MLTEITCLESECQGSESRGEALDEEEPTCTAPAKLAGSFHPS